MQLTDKEAEYPKNVDIVEETHEAREESMKLLDDHGLALLSIAVSNIIRQIAEHPEKLIQEFSK